MNALKDLVERQDPRLSVFVAATLLSNGCPAPVTVRNISRFGATIHVSTTPAVGANVVLVRGKLRGNARVMWTSERRVGLCFSQAIYVDGWIAPPANASQQLADQIFSNQNVVGSSPKRRALIDYPEPTARNDQQITDAIALLADLEDRLSNDAIVVSQHGTVLQNLDLALQILRRVA